MSPAVLHTGGRCVNCASREERRVSYLYRRVARLITWIIAAEGTSRNDGSIVYFKRDENCKSEQILSLDQWNCKYFSKLAHFFNFHFVSKRLIVYLGTIWKLRKWANLLDVDQWNYNCFSKFAHFCNFHFDPGYTFWFQHHWSLRGQLCILKRDEYYKSEQIHFTSLSRNNFC